jgi:hypothetical protein
VIVTSGRGFKIRSHKTGKLYPKVYPSREAAKRRIDQMEQFKHMNKSKQVFVPTSAHHKAHYRRDPREKKAGAALADTGTKPGEWKKIDGDWRIAKVGFIRTGSGEDDYETAVRWYLPKTGSETREARRRWSEEQREKETEKSGNFQYHVTKTENVDKIKKHGIVPFQTTNWIKQGDKTRHGTGEIYSFEHIQDALRWAAKWDWDLHAKFGSGNISIVKFKGGDDWEAESNSPLEQSGASGKWLKRMKSVSAEDIIDATPFTKDYVKHLIDRGKGQPIAKDSDVFKKSVYSGNMGFVEVFRFMRNAPAEKVAEFQKLIKEEKLTSAVRLLEVWNKVKFHPSIYGKNLIPSHKDPRKRRWMHVIGV